MTQEIWQFFTRALKSDSTQKCQNWDFDGVLFSKVENCMSLNLTEELCVMTMKNDAKFEEELICYFKTDMRNFTKFNPST